MKDELLQSALRELTDLLAAPRLWIAFAAIVALFTVTGPFGTYDRLGLVTRLGYWLSLHALAWLVCMTFIVFANQLLVAILDNVLMRMLVGGVAASPVIALVIVGVDMVALGDRFSFASTASEIGVALPVTLLMCIFVWLVMDGHPSENKADGQTASSPPAGDVTTATDPPTPEARPRLLDRLEPDVRAPILHVRVADHYVDVVTRRGHQLVLMRFADALRELDEHAGLQVHRSHWVASGAVKQLLSVNGRLTVELADGTRVPVSRPYAAAVRNRFSESIVRGST